MGFTQSTTIAITHLSVRHTLRCGIVRQVMARNQMTTAMVEYRTHWQVMIQSDTLRSVEADQ